MTEWYEAYGGPEGDWGGHGMKKSGDGYVITGESDSFSAEVDAGDIYLVRTDAGGNVLWTQTFGGSGYDEAYGLDVTDDGGYIITGLTNSFGAGQNDLYLIKTNSP